MGEIRLYGLISILVVSSIALIGIITLGMNIKKLQKILIYLVSFSAGALLGDAFLHLLPESSKNGFTIMTALFILGGITFGLITEKVIQRNHCHMPITKDHVHSFAIMNIVGDFVHNIVDGLIIGVSYLVSIPVGIATTIAVIFHEIPQEIGDFGVLIHGGFSKKKALIINILTGLSSIIGLAIAFLLHNYIGNITNFLIPFAAGSFIYIAGSDLIPELHKKNKTGEAILQVITFLAGIGMMVGLLFI